MQIPSGGAVAVAVGVGVVAVIGAAIVFFDQTDINGPDSGEEIDLSQEKTPGSPDSGEDEDNQGPDSGENEDNQGPDSGEEADVTQEPSSPDSGEEIDLSKEPTSPDSGEEYTASDIYKNKAKGSCDRIADGSTCVEYTGSSWNANTAKLNCSEATFSTKPCPRPALGGCVISAGTPNEVVTWHYAYGGDPYTEVKQYAAQACNALPASRWVE